METDVPEFREINSAGNSEMGVDYSIGNVAGESSSSGESCSS